VKKIQEKLPYLFALAEKEASRGGKLGMEIGSVRERVIIALLMKQVGKKNVKPKIPITETEVDVELFGKPISIKTKTGTATSGIKVIWTVDWEKVKKFLKTYTPSCDLLFVQINWHDEGGFFFIPLKAQNDIFHQLGRANYLKPPPTNTNPRGVEFSSEAVKLMMNHKETKKIIIKWDRPKIEFDPYQEWVKKWA